VVVRRVAAREWRALRDVRLHALQDGSHTATSVEDGEEGEPHPDGPRTHGMRLAL
jgi:hypothetical protein